MVLSAKAADLYQIPEISLKEQKISSNDQIYTVAKQVAFKCLFFIYI